MRALKSTRFLGPGFIESIYSKAMEYELGTAGLLVEREKEILVPYKDIQISGQRLDLLVGGRIIVELKAVESLRRSTRSVNLVPEVNRAETRSDHQFSRTHAEGWRSTNRSLRSRGSGVFEPQRSQR